MGNAQVLELANNCLTKIVCKDISFIGVVNQCLVDTDPNQTETLLQPHQLRAHGVLLDDVPPCHLRIDGTPGTLRLKVGETEVPLYFDGLKTFAICVRPTEEEINSLPHVVLTSEEPYEPRTRLYTRRVYSGSFGPMKFRRKISEPSLEQWQAILGYCSKDTVKATLQNTTRHIKTLDMETRDYMRDYAKSRTTALRPYRINDTLFTDTFYSTIRSIRGNTCFQVFALKKCMYSVATPMKSERFVYGAYEDFITNVGAANAVVSDNAQVYKSEKWRDINRKVVTQVRFTVPYHQSSNFAELIGGKYKYGLVKLFHYTPQAPYCYWDFGLEFMSLVEKYLSKRKLKGRCPASNLRGETCDISIFRFPWFSPVWYYAPNLDFPTDRMKPGFFLGIEPTTGDGFSYIIVDGEKYEDIPLRNVRPIVRSIVRSRSLEDSVPPRVVRDAENNLQFQNAHGIKLASDDVSEEEIYDAITASEADVVEIVDPRSDLNLDSEIDSGILLTTTFNPPVDPDLHEDSDNESTTDNQDDIVSLGEVSMQSENDYPDLLLRTASSEDSDDDEEVEDIVVSQPETAEAATSEETTTLPTTIRIENTFGEEGPVYISQKENDVDEDDPNIDNIGEPHMTNMNIAVAHSVNVTQDPDTDPTEEIVEIRDHKWCGKTLEIQCLYDTGEVEWHPFNLVFNDNPYDLANYLANRKCKLGDSAQAQTYKRWARSHKRAVRRMFKRVIRSNVFQYYSGKHHGTNKKRRSKRIRRAARAKFEDEQSEEALAWVEQTLNARKVRKFAYGLEVPRNWEDVLRIDLENGDTAWQDAIKKEIGALLELECFDVQEEGYRPPEDYQYVRMHLVYDVKVDLRKKARLVCDGSRVDPRGLTTRATVVKGISVRLLDLIANHWNKKILTGDIGNAFVQSKTEEKVFTKLGPEFGPDLAGRIALIVKALYGLTTSAAAFRKALADFLRTLDFIPTRYDRDVWMKPSPTGNGYDYICTHVDDFKIIADDPQAYIDMISGAFFIKESGDPEYYLGNDYKFHDNHQCWTYNAETYEKEAIRKVEEMFDETLAKVKTPLLVEDSHPECDDSPLLKLKEHRQYQCMLGMLQWLHTIARPELGPALATFNRFGTCPREEHLRLLKRVFGYLKFSKNKRIRIDCRPLNFTRCVPDYVKLMPDFLEDYPNACEEVDINLPTPYGTPLKITILVDSDHAHDLITRRSLTGIIAFVGSTPVLWSTKRQGAVATSTYAAEFMALKMATEEAINLRYCLRCLGVPVPNDGTAPTQIFGDNFSVIQSASNPEADLKKKHVALSFHFVREAIAAGIIEPYWLKGEYNLADIMTKQISSTEFLKHLESLYWQPDYHIRDDNMFDEDYNSQM